MYTHIPEEKKKAIYECQKAYLLAKVYHETMEELEKNSKEKVLNENEFFDKDNNRVLNYKVSYTIRDNQIQEFYHLVHKERTENGFIIYEGYTATGFEKKNPHHLTTTYMSWKLLKTAEDNLINVACNSLPEFLRKDLSVERLSNVSYKFTKEFIDIIMKFDTGYKYNVESILNEI